MSQIWYDLDRMVPAPPAAATPTVIYRNEQGIMLCFGTAADTVLEAEAANTYAPGCLYIKVVVAGSSLLYQNTGAAGAVAAFTQIS